MGSDPQGYLHYMDELAHAPCKKEIAALQRELEEAKADNLRYESEIASVCDEDYSLQETFSSMSKQIDSYITRMERLEVQLAASQERVKVLEEDKLRLDYLTANCYRAGYTFNGEWVVCNLSEDTLSRSKDSLRVAIDAARAALSAEPKPSPYVSGNPLIEVQPEPKEGKPVTEQVWLDEDGSPFRSSDRADVTKEPPHAD